MRDFRICTPVWGHVYADIFLQLGLPSLLAQGNIPDSTRLVNLQYWLYVDVQSKNILKKSDAVKRLATFIDIRFIDIAYEHNDNKLTYQKMTNCHRHMLEEAKKDNASVIFVMPDLVFSKNSISVAIRWAMNGKVMVVAGFIMSSLEKTRAIYLAKVHDNVLTLDDIEMNQIGLSNLQKGGEYFYWHNERTAEWLTHFYFVSDGGVELHGFHLYPLIVDPSAVVENIENTFDEDYVDRYFPIRDRVYVENNSKNICIQELCGVTKALVGEPKVVADKEIYVAIWASKYLRKMHAYFFGKGQYFRTHETGVVPARINDTVIRISGLINLFLQGGKGVAQYLNNIESIKRFAEMDEYVRSVLPTLDQRLAQIRRVAIWGAGETGKHFRLLFEAKGITVSYFFDSYKTGVVEGLDVYNDWDVANAIHAVDMIVVTTGCKHNYIELLALYNNLAVENKLFCTTLAVHEDVIDFDHYLLKLVIGQYVDRFEMELYYSSVERSLSNRHL